MELCLPAALHLQALDKHSARAAALGIGDTRCGFLYYCLWYPLCCLPHCFSSGQQKPLLALTQGAAAAVAARSVNTTLSLAPSRCEKMLTSTPLLERLQGRRLKAPHQALPHGRRLQTHCWQRVHPAPPPDQVHLLL